MRRIRIALAIVCLLGMLGPAVAARVGRHVTRAAAPEWFGTRAEVFARLAVPPEQETYRFAVLGDIQQGLSAYRASLVRLRTEGNLTLAVVCGDLVNRKSLPHYRVLFATMEDLDPGLPVVTVPGNHDDSGFYEEHVGPRFWSARVGPDLFVGVDTSEIESPGPFLGDLAAALAEDARHRLVFLHRPVARPGRTRTKFSPLAKVLAEGNVTAVFAGHLHHWETFEHEGVLHVTNGRGGDLTGTTTSDAAVGLVSVGPEGVTVREVGIGERSEILPILVSGVVTRVWEPFGAFLTLGAAILFGLAGILLVPPAGRSVAILAACFLALPATGLPLPLLFAILFVSAASWAVYRRKMAHS